MNEKGYALPLVLVILALLFSMAAALLTQVRYQLDANQEYRDYEICMLVVENAFAEAEAELNVSFDYRGTGGWKDEHNGGSYTIEVEPETKEEYELKVRAQMKKYTKVFAGKAKVDTAARKVSRLSYWMEK